VRPCSARAFVSCRNYRALVFLRVTNEFRTLPVTTIQVIEAYIIIVTLFFYAINIANIVSETKQEKSQVPLTG